MKNKELKRELSFANQSIQIQNDADVDNDKADPKTN